MRLLDRHVAYYYLMSLLLIGSFFIGIFMVVDFITNYADFERHPLGPLRAAGLWYLYTLPSLVTVLYPVLILGGGMLAITSLMRGNQLVACMSAGVHIWRLIAAMPIITVALVSLLYFEMEYYRPYADEKLKEHELSDKDIRNQYFFDVKGSDGVEFWVEAYYRASRKVEHLYVYKIREGGSLDAEIYAREAVWNARREGGSWNLSGGYEFQFDENGDRISARSFDEWNDFTLGNVTPKDLSDQRSTLEQSLSELIETGTPEARFELGVKLSSPLNSLALFLIGVAILLRTRSKSYFASTLICISVAGIFYLLVLFCQSLGRQDIIPANIAIWGPIGTFLLAGGFLWTRLPT
ncbi:MAG: LptF/LptG family permease [Planctomycetes bacterium]|nr:LptF/LptG family permease [Planctomycetota bacterium]